MRVRESKLAKDIRHSRSDKNGNYYLFDDFIVAEIHEGITYSFEASKDIVNFIRDYYGENKYVCYITNRINNYTVSPTDWLKYKNSKNKLNGYAVVSYKESNWINSTLEKLFLSRSVKQFNNLYKATDWAKKTNIAKKLSRV